MLTSYELIKGLRHYYDRGNYKDASIAIKLIERDVLSFTLLPERYPTNLSDECILYISSIMETILSYVDITSLGDKTISDAWEILQIKNREITRSTERDTLFISFFNVKNMIAKEFLRREITSEHRYIESNDISESELDMSEMFWQLRRSQKVNSKIYKMFQDKLLKTNIYNTRIKISECRDQTRKHLEHVQQLERELEQLIGIYDELLVEHIMTK